MKIGARAELVYTPHFRNEDWSATMLFRYEMSTQKTSNQSITMSHLPNDITSATVDAYIGGSSSSNSRSNSRRFLYNGHLSYLDGRYSLGFSVADDGDSKFGPAKKRAFFPAFSFRYNISDEPFMSPGRKWP